MLKFPNLAKTFHLDSIQCKPLHTTQLVLQKGCPVTSSKVRPYEEIPSPPKSWIPFIGHGLLLVKKPNGMEKTHFNIEDLKKKYVPPGVDLLRLRIPMMNPKGDGRLLYLFNLDDVKEVYRAEGKYPRRLDFKAMRALKDRRPDIFGKSPGLLMAEGEEWQNIRSKVQQDMMRRESALYYVDKFQEVGEDFANYIRRHRNPDTKVVEDFIPFAQRYALEGITLITLDTRMGCFDEKLAPEVEEVIRANDILIIQFIKFMTSFPVWDYFPPRWSKVYRDIEDNMAITAGYISKKVRESAERCKKDKNIDPENASLLEKLILKNGVDSGIPTMMAMDALLGGIDTTGSTMSFLLYQLAKNPDKQEKLRSEIKSFGRKTLTTQDVVSMKYFKACQQESFRLMPTTMGHMRMLPNETTIRGYEIPGETVVMWSQMLIGRDPKVFPEPDCFIPERWIEHKDDIHPFAVRPFGHGPRMCPGKRLAEMEILIGVSKLLQNFRIEWAAECDEIEALVKTVNVPSKNLSFRFVDL